MMASSRALQPRGESVMGLLRQLAGLDHGTQRQIGVLEQGWHFVRHYLEMCLAMCVGIEVGTALYFGAAGLLGYARPFSQLPELSVLVVAFAMTAPMAAWMRFRGMAWRPTVEMSAAMLGLGLLLIAAGWLGIAERSALVRLEHSLMMPAMLIPMVLRLDVYTGKACH